MTSSFAQAQAEQTAAAQRANDSDLDMEDPAWLALSELDYRAIDKLILETPAFTPAEVAAKLTLYERREMSKWDGSEAYAAAVQRDLTAMQGWPVSPAMLAAWMAWREHDERYALTVTDAENDALLPERHRLHAELHNLECTTPGDFILKQYARLRDLLTHTNYGPAKEEGTGNRYDIDIDAEIMDGGLFEETEHPACYRDIDATDVGANLLAYGLPHFDAEKWMERAHAIGHRVDLVQQQDESWMFGQCEDLRGEDRDNPASERLRREQHRLQRIIANDYGGEPRVSLLGEEIRRNWPQLVHPLPAEVLS